MKTACALLFLGTVRKVAVPESRELDLAGEAQSAFGEAERPSRAESAEPEPEREPEPGPMYTVPLEPVRPEPTGFAFVEEQEEEQAELPVTFSLPAEPAPAPLEPPSFAAPPATVGVDTVALPFPEEPFFQPEVEAEAPAAADVEPFAESSPLPEPEPFSEPLPPLADTALLAQSPLPADEPVSEPEPTLIDPRIAGTPFGSREPTSYVPPPPLSPVPPPVAPEPAAPAPYRPARFGFEPEAEPEIAAVAPTSRPTEEDLAALDALLNPTATASTEKRSGEQKWEPQFRPSATTAPPRRPPVRVAPAPAAPSRLPILVTALAAVLLTTIAAWYFFLRSPRPAVPAPTPRAVAAAASRPMPTAAGTPAPPPTTAAPTASPEDSAAHLAGGGPHARTEAAVAAHSGSGQRDREGADFRSGSGERGREAGSRAGDAPRGRPHAARARCPPRRRPRLRTLRRRRPAQPLHGPAPHRLLTGERAEGGGRRRQRPLHPAGERQRPRVLPGVLGPLPGSSGGRGRPIGPARVLPPERSSAAALVDRRARPLIRAALE